MDKRGGCEADRRVLFTTIHSGSPALPHLEHNRSIAALCRLVSDELVANAIAAARV